jgi:hypothetical protein
MKDLDDQLMSFSLKILVSASGGTAFTVSASEIFGGIVFFCSQLWEYFLLGEICIDLLTTKLTGHSTASTHFKDFMLSQKSMHCHIFYTNIYIII